jgi:hydrogenase maturation protein HypF
MCGDTQSLADLSDVEYELLRGPERPIVLVARRRESAIAPSVAPGSPRLGLMLPYSPLHHLLVSAFDGPLVMTSGNRSHEPIARDGDEAHRQLAGIADAFCDHDRPIHRRCEDSVVASGMMLRRSRGHAPTALPLPLAAREPLVAVGAQLASTFCVARDREAFVSAHLGDLDAPEAIESFRRDLAIYLEMLGVEPRRVAHDLHPDYASTAWALEQSQLEPIAVQHHHAHAAACMAEHGITGEVLALVFDGTGYGPDGTLWGGELLRCDLVAFERLAHLEPVPLPGGEAAVREPWRAAAAHLERAGRPVPFADWKLVSQSLRVNAPPSSGAGRLFDAVSALLGVCERSTYEGQAAIELEWVAADHVAAPYACRVEQGVIHGADLVAAAHDDLAAARPRGEIAAAFHEGLAAAAAVVCAQAGAQQRTVVLSGGCFNNRRLADSIERRLAAQGFQTRRHRRIPCGDGGISYGQAAIAAARVASCA